MKKYIASAMAAILALSLTACGGEDTDSAKRGTPIEGNTIKIGVFEPTTGENSSGGMQETLGIRYANTVAPTVTIHKTTYTIELVEADNQSDKTAAVSAAQSLVDAGVVGVLGSYGSGVSIAAAQTFIDASIPVIGASCTNPQVTAGNNYYFRVCFLDTLQGKALASYAAAQGYKTAAVISQTGDDYSTGIAAYFKQAFTDEASGGTIVADETYRTNQSDFSELLEKLQAVDADCIFLPCSVSTANTLLPQIRAAGIDTAILAADTWDNDALLNATGDTANGVVFSTSFDKNASAAAKQFTKGFQAYLNEDAQRITLNGGSDTVSAVSALGYDAYMTMIAALETLDGKKDDLTSVDLRNALTEVSYSGITGNITFNHTGDANRDTVYLKKVRNGRATLLQKQVVETK